MKKLMKNFSINLDFILRLGIVQIILSIILGGMGLVDWWTIFLVWAVLLEVRFKRNPKI